MSYRYALVYVLYAYVIRLYIVDLFGTVLKSYVENELFYPTY